jgi:glycosyltransferase involved in cell wall biosynthesis
VNERPLVSICVPVFNGVAFLPACIATVSSQTYPNLEIVVVDNCSTDDTPAILRAWAARDPRVRVVTQDVNVGVVRNRNRCAVEARGEWIKFLDHDDLLEPECVARLVDSAVGAGRRFAFARRTFFYDGVSEAHRERMEREVRRFEAGAVRPGITDFSPDMVADLALEFLGRNVIGEPSTVLVHRSVIDEFGLFNIDLIQIPDLEYWLRVGLTTGMVYCDEPLVAFRIHDSAASTANLIRMFRADRLDQLVLLHEYLYNPHFELVRAMAERNGMLPTLRRRFHRRALRLAVRAALDVRQRETRHHYQQWLEVAGRHPHLRDEGGRVLAGALVQFSGPHGNVDST